MFTIDTDKSIHLTRGDIASIEISAINVDDTPHTFKVGDIVRFKVFEKSKLDNIVLLKDVVIDVESLTAEISLVTDDTRLGELINKPKDYWYDVTLNPDTAPQTILGYDVDGPKIFRLYPEGEDYNDYSG